MQRVLLQLMFGWGDAVGQKPIASHFFHDNNFGFEPKLFFWETLFCSDHNCEDEAKEPAGRQ